MKRVELRQALLEPDELGATVDEQVLAELVAAVHLEHETAEVAQASFAQLEERAALAAHLARGRQRAPDRAGRGRGRRRGRLAVGVAAEARQARHQAATLTAAVG